MPYTAADLRTEAARHERIARRLREAADELAQTQEERHGGAQVQPISKADRAFVAYIQARYPNRRPTKRAVMDLLGVGSGKALRLIGLLPDTQDQRLRRSV